MKLAIVNPLRVGASGGVVKHLEHVLPFWLNSPLVSSLRIYTPDGIDKLYSLPENTVRKFPVDDYRHQFRALRGMMGSERYDVVLFTTARHIQVGELPTVVMARNSEPLQRADYRVSLRWRARLWFLRQENRLAFAKATRVLAVSRHMRDLITGRFGVTPNRVDVVYHGVDASEGKQPGLPVPNVAPGFLFTAGSLVPYRGTEDMISALATIRRTDGCCPTVVVAGDHRTPYGYQMARLAERLHVAEYVRWAGQLSRQEMTWCYRGCAAFVFTSRAEACPNTVLESMAHGCVCISCNHEPMPEFYEDSALYYDYGDSRGLADQIRRLIALADTERQVHRDAALSRANSFTWERTASNTLSVVERALREYSKS